MASNVNTAAIGSLLLANSQIPSLNIQSCKNLGGGNLTNLAILQRDSFSEDKRREKKGEEESRKKKSIHDPCNGVSYWWGEELTGISISMFAPQNNGIRFLCQVQMNWAFSSLRTTPCTYWHQLELRFLRHFQFPLKYIHGEKGFLSHANNSIVNDVLGDCQEGSGKVSRWKCFTAPSRSPSQAT